MRWVHIPGGPEYRRERGDGLRRVTYVDTDLGVAVIETDGMHLSYRASGTARLVGDLAGRRFAEGLISFPVEATNPGDAVMRAIDESDATLLQVRRVGAERKTRFLYYDDWIDIVATPGVQVTPELLLLAAVTAPWIVSFFLSGGGG